MEKILHTSSPIVRLRTLPMFLDYLYFFSSNRAQRVRTNQPFIATQPKIGKKFLTSDVRNGNAASLRKSSSLSSFFFLGKLITTIIFT